MILRFRNLFCAFILGNLCIASLAGASDSDLCDQSINLVAKNSIVPREVIYKIARLESGRHIDGRQVSWPWSLNNSGRGYFLKDRAEALAKLAKLKAQGKTNIDVGCMQLNIRWHAEFFKNFAQMINPLDNVQYAVSYLEELYEETNSWEKAVKYYHSRNAKFNAVYYAKYKEMQPPRKSEKLVSSIHNKATPVLKNPITKKKQSLFWTGSTGALIQKDRDGAISFADADIRNFSVLPLIEM